MIREKIKEAMDIRGVKAIELAEHVGITKSSMSLYLNGKMRLQQEKLETMLEFLRIRLEIEE